MQINHIFLSPVPIIFPYFSDLQKFVDVHPVVYRMERLAEADYVFYEKIDFLFIPVRFSYPVTVEKVVPNQQVILSSHVQKGVFLHLVYDFVEIDGKTQLKETVTIQASPLVKAIFEPILKSSHLKMAKEIKRKLENTI